MIFEALKGTNVKVGLKIIAWVVLNFNTDDVRIFFLFWYFTARFISKHNVTCF